jgi:tyrosine aminotransferase
MLVRINLARFPSFKDDVEFSTAFYREEAVFVLPGHCFEAGGYFRIVLASPADVMKDVCERLADFCQRHRSE